MANTTHPTRRGVVQETQTGATHITRRGVFQDAAAIDRDRAVLLDGSDYASRTTALAGTPADSKFILCSFWCKRASAAAEMIFEFDVSGNTDNISCQWNVSDNIVIRGDRAGVGTASLLFTGASNQLPSDDAWHQVMFTADANASGGVVIYIDGSSSSGTLLTHLDFNYGWSNVAQCYVGANRTPSQWLNGSIGEFYLTNETYDLTSSANRDKFLNGVTRADLGSDGSTPTATAPLVYLSGGRGSFAENKGSGGAFTLSGIVTSVSIGDLIADGAINQTLTESLVFADTDSESASFALSLVDSLALGDTASGIRALFQTIIESIAFADTATESANFAKQVVETLSLSDTSQISTKTLLLALVDGLSLSDSALGVGGQEIASTKGGRSMTLRQMRTLERKQLLEMIRQDDDIIVSLLAGILRNGRN